jgi:NAD(P)-dependent dehydrogenase (short-subunit alcohol dehydrogenase family)
MLSGLAGKVAVVTGGAGVLGGASALRLSREGCRVVVMDINGDGARKVAESLPGESIAVEEMARRGPRPRRCAGRGRRDEIASVVAFLLSDEASCMAGEVVSVDGGSSIASTCGRPVVLARTTRCMNVPLVSLWQQ